MFKRKLLICLMLVLIICGIGGAAFIAGPSGTQITFSYTEPTVNIDGTPLTDLAKVVVSYDDGIGVQVGKEVPATAPAGGGFIQDSFLIPGREGQEYIVKVWANTVDTSGNKSPNPSIVSVRIDRLPPGEVQ